uniref:Putative secreted protein n=1 Tax=Ixodes ricinus TaxID=34613 RepID=V5H1S7_IXORI
MRATTLYLMAVSLLVTANLVGTCGKGGSGIEGYDEEKEKYCEKPCQNSSVCGWPCWFCKQHENEDTGKMQKRKMNSLICLENLLQKYNFELNELFTDTRHDSKNNFSVTLPLLFSRRLLNIAMYKLKNKIENLK